MRRSWKISDASQRANLLIQRSSSRKPKTLLPLHFITPSEPTNPFTFLLPRAFCSSQLSPSSSPWTNSFNRLIGLFDKSYYVHDPKVREELTLKVLGLKDELVKLNRDSEGVYGVLEQKGLPLFTSYLDGSALIELLEQLRGFPQLAVEVFNWRRKHTSFSFPITPDEYTKGITVAGRARNVDLALELFTEAVNNRIKTSSSYNALMGAYMSNGLSEKCQSLFREFKRDEKCIPTIVTYNILISVFGRLMLMDHMEATLQQIHDSNLSPNLNTFNNLIAGYVTAWMWDRMEDTFRTMKEKSLVPDTNTYMLMVRGYSHAGKLEKMEAMYELVKHDLQQQKQPSIVPPRWGLVKHDLDRANVHLLRSMISAYCKSSYANRIKRIEELMKLIPEGQYCPWLNVILIRVYAQEELLVRMEKLIDDAFEHHTSVRTLNVMRSIITAYYRLNDVDKLAVFVKRAECAGWRICRSLYHCKMVMYGSQNRLEEMENVLVEMEKFNLRITKKTLVILYRSYSNWGPRCKLEQLVGMMCKHGCRIRLDDYPSRDAF